MSCWIVAEDRVGHCGLDSGSVPGACEHVDERST
jgi:hypothetical protein